MRAGPLLSHCDAVAKAVPQVPEPHSASSTQSLVQRPQRQRAAAPHCALLSHAADSVADFIVMGGYGHSRLREFVLGGATRGLLKSMTAPTLMSH